MKSQSVDAPHALEMATRSLGIYREECGTRQAGVKQLLEDLMFYCEEWDIPFSATLRDATADFKVDRKLSSTNMRIKK